MNADLGNSWSMSLLADLAQPNVFTLTLSGPFTFPNGGVQRITLGYDQGSQILAGIASSNMISIPLDATTFPQFLHGFTAGSSMAIDEGPLAATKVDLTGTSAAISKLGQCTEADDFTQLPAPWHAPTTGEVAAAAAEMINRQTAASAPPSGDDQSNQAPSQQAQSPSPPAPPASPAPTPAAALPAPAAVAPAQPGVNVTALTCSIGEMGLEVQGLLVNQTGVSQSLMRIVEVFQSQTGAFVSTTFTFATYNPVLPGQTSPLTDIGGLNPVIAKVQVSTADEDGAELPTSGQTTVSCDGGGSPPS